MDRKVAAVLLEPKTLDDIPPAQRDAMEEAAIAIVEIAEELAEKNKNIVSLLVGENNPFTEWRHYPKGDIFDKKSHAQYYYHSHFGGWEEHGHFHTFTRAGGIPQDCAPFDHPESKNWPSGKDTIAHLIAISMDHYGRSTHLFTTNRWVTKETFFDATAAIELLDRFSLSNVKSPAPTDKWISAMLVLFRPQIERLLKKRDEVIADALKSNVTAFEDKELEITSICPASIEGQMDLLGMFE
jgi:hypothetical protein